MTGFRGQLLVQVLGLLTSQPPLYSLIAHAILLSVGPVSEVLWLVHCTCTTKVG